MRAKAYAICKLLAGLAAATNLAVLNFPAVAARAAEPLELRIASEGARPPYNYFDQNNELAGFDIDLGRDLCARMNARCTFVAQEWDRLVPNLVARRADAIMAALAVTDELKQKIAFSAPYVIMPNAFLASRGGDLASGAPRDLKGRAIGVVGDDPHEAYLQHFYPKSQIKPYDGLDEAILDLAEGRLDAVFGDKDAIMAFMKNRHEALCCKLVADVARDPDYFGEGVAIGLRREDVALKSLFDKALAESLADGAFAAIAAKYFDFSVR